MGTATAAAVSTATTSIASSERTRSALPRYAAV
jgi:hypothetical protein